jgi:hypothetical protein
MIDSSIMYTKYRFVIAHSEAPPPHVQ